METTLYKIKFKDGRIFNVFCRGKHQKFRLINSLKKIENQIENKIEFENGIHTIKEFEDILNSFNQNEKELKTDKF